MRMPIVKVVRYTLVVLFAAFVLIQLVPYGRNHDNPPVVVEPEWDSPQTRAMAKRACFDCHSNETVWPWYTWVAPFSWLVYSDVTEGRAELNFSDWRGGTREGERPDEIREQIANGEMPPFQYLMIHSEARLTGEEKRELAGGLSSTVTRSVNQGATRHYSPHPMVK